MVTPTTGYVPERGDVVWLNFNPQAGYEQAGRRPALVLSPSAYNDKVGLAIVCPITGKMKGYPFEVRIPPGLPIAGVVLADQVKSLDWDMREVEWICVVPEATTEEVVRLIESLLKAIA